MKTGPDYYFYQNDHLGTPQKLTAINGAVVWAAKYTSFGEANVDGSSTVTNNLRFAGQYYDNGTGLQYNYHRYYDHRIGRYLNADPIGLAGGINLFLYSTNNPINITDRFGLFTLKYHREILESSLSSHIGLKSREFALIATGNAHVDLMEMSDMHFDNSKFIETLSKIDKLWKEIEGSCDEELRLHRFGQITHAIQDFYSHSNYVEEFLKANPNATPDDITTAIMMSGGNLESGSFSIFSWIFGTDTHKTINKDAPNTFSGSKLSNTGNIYFDYAKSAAIKHTTFLYQRFKSMK
jgi:RHS repeat-associated protein